MIENSCEKYKSFGELVECRDAEIFSTIPFMLVLTASLDTGAQQEVASKICERFFPSLFNPQEHINLRY